MSTGPDKGSQTLFDSLITELLNSDSEQSLIDICLSGKCNQKAITSVPLRQRLIAHGFVKKLSLEELNDKLMKNNCDKLYARSLSEATLIYAFRNNMTYSEWKQVFTKASSLKSEIAKDTLLSDSRITLGDIKYYVLNNSVYENELAVTMHKTQLLQEKLINKSFHNVNINEFLLSNISSFCAYREKSRYYFCKYLMYYLESKKNDYLKRISYDCKNFKDVSDLKVFKGITALARKKHTSDEANSFIGSVHISFSDIYDSFQSFFFEYTSRDWMSIILEKYGDIDQLNDKQKNSLASYIRNYYRGMKKKSDSEILAWQKEELKRKEATADKIFSYQTNRAGEHYLRKVVRGELDLDRTTLLSFMLFFDSNASLPEEHRITVDRLNDILTECGFSELDETNYVDGFFIDYMSAEDPITFLIEEAEIMAMSEENFYLFKTYLNSKNNEVEWHKYC